ncbi:hypothetical protein MKX03_011004, partial [Papaver bracteatum]
MVNLVLMITTELHNLTDLQPQGDCDDVNFPFYIKIKCGNCGEVIPKETYCLIQYLFLRCKFCGREGNITMIPGKGRLLTLEAGETEEYVRLMLFDRRGIEPVEFSFGDGWKVQSKASKRKDKEENDEDSSEELDKPENMTGAAEERSDNSDLTECNPETD